MPKALGKAEGVEPAHAEPKMPAVGTNSSTLSQENVGGGNLLNHKEPKMSVVGTNSPTKSRKYRRTNFIDAEPIFFRRWGPTHPRRAENAGG